MDNAIVDHTAHYTLNYRQFIHVLRCTELKRIVEHKIDKQAAIILGLFLDDSKLIDKSEVFDNSEVLSFSQIHAKLKELMQFYQGKQLS